MSLDQETEKKISNITYKTGLPGFYQFESKEDAASTIERYKHYINDDGSFKKIGHDACCDPIYQQLSAAVDYFKFEIKRDTYTHNYRKPSSKKNNNKNNKNKVD